MADSTQPHFFQPLLPGFHNNLNIPVAFFSKHIEARNDRNKTAKLRSDASDKTWTVKIDGSRFTDGWKDFAVAHDLRIGDITVFRHEGEMVFHVTALGPSCCEIQYTLPHNKNDDNKEDGPREKRLKKNPSENRESSSDHSSFVAKVTASSLTYDKLYLPLSFASSNGLNKMHGKKIILLNEEGRPWSLNLRCNNAGKHTYVKPGYRSFCVANGIKAGDCFMFKLGGTEEKPVLSWFPADSNFDNTPLECCPEDSDDVNSLSSDPGSEDDGSKFQENEKESPGDKINSHECLENHFVRLTLTPYAFKKCHLILPRWFVRVNGLNKPGKITLLGRDGAKWVVDLLQNKSTKAMRLGKDWREFCVAQGVKINNSFELELIWEEEASPVLKFRTKVNSV